MSPRLRLFYIVGASATALLVALTVFMIVRGNRETAETGNSPRDAVLYRNAIVEITCGVAPDRDMQPYAADGVTCERLTGENYGPDVRFFENTTAERIFLGYFSCTPGAPRTTYYGPRWAVVGLYTTQSRAILIEHFDGVALCD